MLRHSSGSRTYAPRTRQLRNPPEYRKSPPADTETVKHKLPRSRPPSFSSPDREGERLARRAKGVELYESGLPVTDVLAGADISAPTLYDALREAGVPRRLPAAPAEKLAEALRLYGETDLPPAEIDRLTGITEDTLHHHRRLLGQPRRPPPTHQYVPSPAVAEALRLYAETETPVHDIYSLTGVSPGEFLWARNRLGVPTRDWSGHPPSVKEATLGQLQGGANFVEAAARGGVTRATAARWSEEADLAPNHPRAHPPEVRDAVVAELRDGAEAAPTALAHGVGKTTALTWANQEDIILPGAGRSGRKPPAMHAAVLAELRAGATAAEAAAPYDVDPSTVADWAAEAGIELVQQSRATRRAKQLWPRLVTEMRAGASAYALAKAHGLDYETLRQKARAEGLPPQTPPRKEIPVWDLAALDARAAEIQRAAAMAPRTEDGYESAWGGFVDWCKDEDR